MKRETHADGDEQIFEFLDWTSNLNCRLCSVSDTLISAYSYCILYLRERETRETRMTLFTLRHSLFRVRFLTKKETKMRIPLATE
jgi:hypothetical protein